MSQYLKRYKAGESPEDLLTEADAEIEYLNMLASQIARWIKSGGGETLTEMVERLRSDAPQLPGPTTGSWVAEKKK